MPIPIAQNSQLQVFEFCHSHEAFKTYGLLKHYYMVRRKPKMILAE